MTDAEFAELLRTRPPGVRPNGGVETYWRWGDLFVISPNGSGQRWRHTTKKDDRVMMRRVAWNPAN